MEDLNVTPHEISDLLWHHINRPVLIVSENSGNIIRANPAALKYFKIKGYLEGVSWPSVLSLANVPPETDLSPLKLNDQDNIERKVQSINFQYQDNVDFVEKYLNIQILRPPKNADNYCAVVINDYTSENQSIQARSDFVTLTSHQLRTPLSAGRWNLDIFYQRYAKNFDDKQKHILNNVQKSLAKMNNLVNALLSVSRIETGKLEVNPHPIEIRDLLQNVINEITPEVDDKKINLVVSTHKNLPHVILDDTLIRYLFINLIHNSIKYTDPGGEISVFMSRKNDVIMVQIADNGVGIPKSSQHNVFKKFFRSPEAAKRDPSGSGLGLYLSKMIVEKSGGNIWFESHEGKGTVFWFTLPMNNKYNKVS